MIPTATPIYTAIVNGHTVRFFRGPGDAPDLPWHAHDDLLSALLPRAPRRVLRAQTLKAWGDACRTVEVKGEPVLLAPHAIAQGLIGAARDGGKGIAKDVDAVDRDYLLASVEALEALTSGQSSAEKMRFAGEAFRNSGSAGDAP